MISVVIPTLNAAAYLPRALSPLVRPTVAGLVKQVIVADGGSSDETLAIADAAGCDIVTGARGRGAQLHAGAAAARAPWLLFQHADTELSDACVEEATRFMRAPNARQRAAAFKLSFDDDSPQARMVVFLARLRARWFKVPYGDQGLLISRFLYDAVGGYADLPLMEDVDLVRRIGARRMVMLEAEAVTSADRYRCDGFTRRACRNLALTARYLMGADPAILAKAYD
ncbi:MAG: TIGR04283 family arsenosugar biosynthesis glycosyltransferase [Hyphomonadaceae bacterium]|nr:TIGR04283 family arsenosugar biosynthesis glycosyltransferase [Hyphomonadaceae bacterium]